MSVLNRVLRAGEGKLLREMEKLAVQVNQLEPDYEPLSDQELAALTISFRQRYEQGETLDQLQVEAFAVVREAAKRVLGQRHYDVQVIGAGALHRGMVAEMKTGEGKTLVSTMPVYLNALSGKGVHVVTVNDYLASRDAEWMGSIYRFLGLEVGLIVADLTPAQRRPQYAADITYGTNNELGFDYLRDNMAMRPTDLVQRGHAFAIVDEVDSILIDEARTPLIISGRVSDSAKWYRDFAKIAARLRRDRDYTVEEGKRQVLTTEPGVELVENILGVENLYDHTAVDFVHHLETAIKAKELYHKDVEYLVVQGEVKIVDEFTGRVLDGRRYSEGLHQAIEAKEGVHIKDENQTLATITLQNYFRMYEKLAGMTGTAETEASEFAQIYRLEVLPIPTNEPVSRADQSDLIYRTEQAKLEALVEDVVYRHHHDQPVLLGTVSIEKSELVSRMLKKHGVPHQVLNAKQHAREAEIIAQAGKPGAVTVATNMAGRGVDIMLGGNPEGMAKAELSKQGSSPAEDGYQDRLAELTEKFEEMVEPDKQKVLEAGGLYVIGTERHESRRIDNQLRGRSGRQGDPGESRFYLSVEDDLMRRFSGDRLQSMMQRLRIPEDAPIEHRMISKAVERAQSQVEAQNFEIRKNVLKYDEVMNRQREVVYSWRESILIDEETGGPINEWLDETIEATVRGVVDDPEREEEWDWEDLSREVGVFFPLTLDDELRSFREQTELLLEQVQGQAQQIYELRRTELGPEAIGELERSVVLNVIDNKWREHLSDMDYLRSGIGLRAMGQRDPLSEYQREGYSMFSELVEGVKRDAIRYLFHVQVIKPTPARPTVSPAATSGGPNGQTTVSASSGKVGRNQPCPCGSGKKYKRCHGAVTPVGV